MSASAGIRRFHRWVSMAFTPGRATLQFPRALAAQCGWMREGGLANSWLLASHLTKQTPHCAASPKGKPSRPRSASLSFVCVAGLHGTQGA